MIWELFCRAVMFHLEVYLKKGKELTCARRGGGICRQMTTYKFKANNTGVLELRQNSQQRAADL